MNIPAQRLPARSYVPAGERDSALELLASNAYDDSAISEVIRPAAVLPENAARAVLSALLLRDARAGGRWIAEPTSWRRYDDEWPAGSALPCHANLMGTLQVIYGSPSRYEVTVFRVTITSLGAAQGWTVSALCDEAFGYGGLTLDSCPRAELATPPRAFRMR